MLGKIRKNISLPDGCYRNRKRENTNCATGPVPARLRLTHSILEVPPHATRGGRRDRRPLAHDLTRTRQGWLDYKTAQQAKQDPQQHDTKTAPTSLCITAETRDASDFGARTLTGRLLRPFCVLPVLELPEQFFPRFFFVGGQFCRAVLLRQKLPKGFQTIRRLAGSR